MEATLLAKYPIYWIPLALTVLAAVIDLFTERIPNPLTLLLFLLAPVLGLTGWFMEWELLRFPGEPFWYFVLGVIVPLVLMVPGYVAGKLGMGDVKLLAALGAWVGMFGILMVFIWMALIGAVMALGVWLVQAVRRRPGAKVWFRYGPAIALGFAIFLIRPALVIEISHSLLRLF